MTTSGRHNPADRVIVFIDGSNVLNRLRDIQRDSDRRINLEYGKFVAKLAGERRLVRAYYYAARVDRTREPELYQQQQRFYYNLELIPRFELRAGRLVYPRTPGANPYEKGVDVKLATDMLLHAARDNYDVAILVSGDTDFVDAVQGVKDLGKNVEIALFNPSGSRALRSVADEVIELDIPFLEDCQFS